MCLFKGTQVALDLCWKSPLCLTFRTRFDVVRFYCPEVAVQLGRHAVRITLRAAWQPQLLGRILSLRGGLPAGDFLSRSAKKVAPNRLPCFHNAAAETQVLRGSVFSAAAEHDAAPSCLGCFHSDAVLHHARTAAHCKVKSLRSKLTRIVGFWC